MDFFSKSHERSESSAQRMPTFVHLAGVPHGVRRFDRERLPAQQAVGAVVDQDFARAHRPFERIIAQHCHPQLIGSGGKGLFRQKSLVTAARSLVDLGRQFVFFERDQGDVILERTQQAARPPTANRKASTPADKIANPRFASA